MTVEIIIGDALTELRKLPAESADCCVTSPPYFGLRDYGVDGQLGLETTPDEVIAGMVRVFEEVRRVLRSDGTLWLNMGDSYAGSGRGGYIGGKSGLEGSIESQDQSRIAKGSQVAAGLHEKARQSGSIGRAWTPAPPGLKQKDLIGIPWMLAFALRADGWYLRQDIIWSKPNPMPESVRDRCTKSHEYLFLMAKRHRYYFDAEAIMDGVASDTIARAKRGRSDSHKWADGGPGNQTIGKVAPSAGRIRGVPPRHAQYPESSDQSGLDNVPRGLGRNKRSVWNVATQPFGEAHFATFPPDLIEPCIKAGCPRGGTVLDPFFGAGTTGLVADRLRRNCVGIELNPEYAAIARHRIDADRGALLDAMEAAA
jgi:DNA modification methylase